MDHLVAKERNDERAGGNDNDTSPARHVRINRMQQLCTDDDIDGRPAQAGKAVEDGDDFHAVIAEEESRQDHLAHAEARTEGGEECDGDCSQKVDEERGQDGVDEAQPENRDR